MAFYKPSFPKPKNRKGARITPRSRFTNQRESLAKVHLNENTERRILSFLPPDCSKRLLDILCKVYRGCLYSFRFVKAL